MDKWATYEARAMSRGESRRDSSLIRERRMLLSKIPNNLSYQEFICYPSKFTFNIDDDNKKYSFKSSGAITKGSSEDEKYIYTLPEDKISIGSIIYWANCFWLIYKTDPYDEIYQKGKMYRCNHLLKWINDESQILEQWVYIEDGTTKTAGETEGSSYFVTAPNTRTIIFLSKNEHTVLFDRTNRFLIDDIDAPHKMSFNLTKPTRYGYTLNNEGVFRFVLSETTATEYDNHELGIANYYKHFPKDETETEEVIEMEETEETVETEESSATTKTGKRMWL